MVGYVPRRILGKWRDGYALDLHTVRSIFVGDDEFGHPRFETERTGVGELLYRLKNKSDQTVVPEIVDAAVEFLKAWNPRIDLIVPVPPSTKRAVQPVLVLANAISTRLGSPVAESVSKKREVPQLKNVYDLDQRAKLVEDLFAIDIPAVQGKSLLLFDDLFRSGATMNAITGELYETGKASDVFALAITRTRSNR